MYLFVASSIVVTATVLLALLFCVTRRQDLLLRPSVIFIGTFWLQVELSSTINAGFIYERLQSPWRYFILVHGIPLLAVLLVPITFRRSTEINLRRVQTSLDQISIKAMLGRGAALLVVIYLLLVVYLFYVPFNQTGLYAILFDREHFLQYRESSMKLLDVPWLQYSFSILEKALGPVAAAFMALAIVPILRTKQLSLIPLPILGVVAAAAPASIYGARGPAAMIVMAAIFAYLVTRLKRLNVRALVFAMALALIPTFVIMAAQRQDYSLRGLSSQMANAFDRAVGRGFIDNVWHLSFVEVCGFHGIGVFPKIASLVGRRPIDIMNIVGQANFGEDGGFGIVIPGVSDEAPVNTAASRAHITRRLCPSYVTGEPKAVGSGANPANSNAVDLKETASASASFMVVNYTAFGIWTVPLSLAFIIGLDLLLLVYARMPLLAVPVAIGASAVPILNLSFSMFTTVLASKGLLIVPLIAWISAADFSRSLMRERIARIRRCIATRSA